MNREVPDVQAEIKKAEEPEIKLPASIGSSKKQESSRKDIYFCFIDYAKAFDCVDHSKLWKILRDGNTRQLHVSPEKSVQVKKQQLELDMDQQTGSKSGKDYTKAVCSHHAYLTYMQSISYEILGWKKHKMESRLLGEILITWDMQITPPLWQKVKRD